MTAIDAGEPTREEDVMDRADVYRAAHALVTSLKWDTEVTVYDVLQIAKFLEDE